MLKVEVWTRPVPQVARSRTIRAALGAAHVLTHSRSEQQPLRCRGEAQAGEADLPGHGVSEGGAGLELRQPAPPWP